MIILKLCFISITFNVFLHESLHDLLRDCPYCFQEVHLKAIPVYLWVFEFFVFADETYADSVADLIPELWKYFYVTLMSFFWADYISCLTMSHTVYIWHFPTSVRPPALTWDAF